MSKQETDIDTFFFRLQLSEARRRALQVSFDQSFAVSPSGTREEFKVNIAEIK